VTSALARTLILDELFDLALYRSVRRFASGDLARMLDELITIESRHAVFWQRFFGVSVQRLDGGRRLKLALLTLACRLLGAPAIYLVLEAIEVYGVRKYLALWRHYEGEPLGTAVKEILTDELGHEDQVVSAGMTRRIDPERVRNFFLGFNDGLVEILGAVSGFFAAFADVASVLVASCTVAVAGALSMATGAFAASHSEREVRRVETGKRAFLGDAPADAPGAAERSAAGAAVLVGVSYLVGAVLPVVPVLLGARSLWASLAVGVAAAIVVSATLAFLSGMAVRRRVAINLALLGAAVVVTYVIGLVTTRVWGIAV
jgi:VIT1/CCC1 family predicted Fe2+/Mn2+ transporter